MIKPKVNPKVNPKESPKEPGRKMLCLLGEVSRERFVRSSQTDNELRYGHDDDP